MSVGAIIVAAGRGDRMGAPVPKQLLDLGGRSMLQRSVALFDRASGGRRTGGRAAGGVTWPTDRRSSGRRRGRCAVVAGGERRQDSVAAALAALSAAVDVVLVHDAARPFADAALIDRVLAGVAETGAAVPAIAVRDTVKRVDAAHRPRRRDDSARRHLWLAQTPQGFRRAVLDAAHGAGRARCDGHRRGDARRAGRPCRWRS